jgi:hypothetical protein
VRLQLTALTAVVLVAACSSANDPPGMVQASGRSSNWAPVNVSSPYRLSTHCGVLEISFDGRLFYLESLNPADVLGGLDQPEDAGTMVLHSAHVAEFHTAAGHTIHFVDSWPGVIGNAYPFTVHVLPGNRLRDEPFAGRMWHASGTLPGVSGPPFGNGQDRFTAVAGCLTLVSADQATFVAPDGTTVEFVRTNPVPGCD